MRDAKHYCEISQPSGSAAAFLRDYEKPSPTCANPAEVKPGRSAVIKTLFVLPDLPGGGRSLLNMLRNLDSRRFHATLFLLRPLIRVDRSEIAESIDLIIENEEKRRLRYGVGGIFKRLVKAAADNDIVVGSLELDATYLAYVAAKIERKPVIGWVHTALGEYLKMKQRWHAPLVRAIYPRLDRVVFVSAGAAASTRRVVKLNASRVEVIPNSLDLAAIEDVRRSTDSWECPVSDLPIVMAVGRLNGEKGFDLLIRAHRRLRNAGCQHLLVILGEGPLRGELTQLVDRLRVNDTVRMPGYFLNPYSAMRKATILAVPSHFEGFPMVLLEALALGLPTVATNCPGGSSEMLDGGRYGLLVPPDDETALAGAIGQLLSNPARREQLREAGLERVRQYSPVNIAFSWQQLFADVLAGRQASRNDEAGCIPDCGRHSRF